MIYEIVSPSDPCTIAHDDPAVIAIAIFVFGDGSYGGSCLEGDGPVIPIFRLFGEGEVEAWFHDTFGADFNAFSDTPKTDIEEALDSIVIGGPAAREVA